MFRSHPLKRSREDTDDSYLPFDSKKFCPWQPAAIGNSHPFVPQPAGIDHPLPFRAPTLTPIDSSDEEDNPKNISRSGIHRLHAGTTTEVSHVRPSHQNSHPAKLLLSGGDLSPWQQAHTRHHNHPSPIPQALVDHSLDINESALTAPGFGHDDFEWTPKPAPAPSVSMSQSDTFMEDIIPSHKDLPAIRLPSPVSDTEMSMADTAPETEQEYPPRVPTPGLDYGNLSTQPVAAHPMSLNAWKNSTATPTPCPVPHRRSALVMGYRADCDKCRCKVPGHYSHIIERN